METTWDRIRPKLEVYKLKPSTSHDGGQEWRCNSPLRPGANSHSFCVFVEADGEKGTFDDKTHGDSGNLYALARKLGVEPVRRQAANTKRAYKDMAEYAAAHGVSVEVLTAAKWQQVDYQNRPALAFPTATGTRYRFLDGKENEAAYKSEVGYKACWYGLKRAVILADEKWQPIVLCNGEISTLVAQHYGLAACAVTSGEKKYPENLIAEFRAAYPGGPVVIAMDCDQTGHKAAENIKAQLDGYQVTIVDLGLSEHGDLADFCTIYTSGVREALFGLMDKPLEVKPPEREDPLLALANAANNLTNALKQDDRTRRAGDVQLLMADVQAMLDRLQSQTAAPLVRSFEDIVAESIPILTDRFQHPDEIQGLRCNIPSLDKAIGGFAPEFYVIYGATSMGKSTLAVSFVKELIKQGPGLIAPTESPPGRWLMKLAACILKIPSDKLETGHVTKQEFEAIMETYQKLRAHNCRMMEAGSPSPGQLRAAVKRGIEDYGIKWVVVDSASKMSYPGASGIYDITRGVSNGLQDLYQECGIPIIVTSQVGRDVSERPKGQKMPRLEDGYGGGIIEFNAGVVLGLYTHQYYVDLGTEEPSPRLPAGTSFVRILKNRWRGDARKTGVDLAFVGGSGFYELAKPHQKEPEVTSIPDEHVDLENF